MNILITSAGRRVSLIRFAQETLKRFAPDGKVYAIDMVPDLSAACQIADFYAKAPRVNDPSYGPFLLNYCIRHTIMLIIPTIDTELSILADLKASFVDHGIIIAVSEKSICDTFYLKSSTFEFFVSNGFNTPRIIADLEHSNYPLFAKLDNSSCSLGASPVSSYQEASALYRENKSYIFQELVVGEEYTVDFYLSKAQEPLAIIPRKRLEVRAGEVSKSITCKEQNIIKEVKKISKSLQGAWGPMTLQLFKTSDQKLIFIEINPRVGGGYPLSYHAGMNIFELMIREMMGEKLTYQESWEDTLTMLRYDAEVLTHANTP
ncbi:ATP-grasp domain-containing protein [Sulfuricurvum sp.]|uniref:ATP-grasp domain-containing protein n=1 Tax=Sulfuricurvum sp. TaxID=2025608 RepID=UPI00261B86A7|nr:ATP-grasp domain-containing protein [Sulfuricurvum sp.]MDD2780904.1 ATP-grasp domain-containing protein [Sulfuricurvum sp.]